MFQTPKYFNRRKLTETSKYNLYYKDDLIGRTATDTHNKENC